MKIEERLKQTDEHFAKHLSWTQLTHPMKIQVRTCTDCFPAFYTDVTGYRASTFDARPQFKHSFQKYFYGTPFHALMISINNFEKYHFGDRQHYQKELSILDHIKYHNPRVKDLHKESLQEYSLVHAVKVNRVTLSEELYKQFESEPWIVWCQKKE